MREYELTVIYDLAVAEAGGQDAAPGLLSTLVEARGGSVLKIDHWGRRRMAYPIKRAIDGDYVVARVMLDPAAVNPLEAALRIDERVYRHLIVRADELPQPRVPKEPRREAASDGAAEAVAVAAAPGPAAEDAEAEPFVPEPEPVAEAPDASDAAAEPATTP